jgi:hypothetical protein
MRDPAEAPANPDEIGLMLPADALRDTGAGQCKVGLPSRWFLSQAQGSIEAFEAAVPFQPLLQGSVTGIRNGNPWS